MPTTSPTTTPKLTAEVWSFVASAAFLAIVTAFFVPWPKLPTHEPTRRIELPCKPPPSLLVWWDRDNVWAETNGGTKGPAKGNLEYWHDGELVASRKKLHSLTIETSKPYVTWRAVIGSEVHIALGGPESEAFKTEIERCESLPVVFSRPDESPRQQESQIGRVD